MMYPTAVCTCTINTITTAVYILTGIIHVVVRKPKALLLLCCCIRDLCAERSVLLSHFSVSFMYDFFVLVGGGICLHL